jgi:hypothetical protein
MQERTTMAGAAAADAGSQLDAARGAVLSMALRVAMLAGIRVALICNGRRLLKPEEDLPRRRVAQLNPNLQEIRNAYE